MENYQEYQERLRVLLSRPKAMAYLLEKVVPEYREKQLSEIAASLGAPIVGQRSPIAGADYDVVYTGHQEAHRPFLVMTSMLTPGNRFEAATAAESTIAWALQLGFERQCGAGLFLSAKEVSYVVSILICIGIPDRMGNRVILGTNAKHEVIYGRDDLPPVVIDSYAVRLDGEPRNDNERELIKYLHTLFNNAKTEEQVE